MPMKNGSPVPELASKGIVSENKLREVLSEVFKLGHSVWLESDMRALFNPTRMLSIERATQNLVSSAQRACPSCGQIGYTIVERLPGLLCSDCGSATEGIRAEVYSCLGCTFREEKPLLGKKLASASECEFCNP